MTATQMNKQKSIIKQIYKELNNRNTFIGYHDYNGKFGFISPYYCLATDYTYDEPKAEEQYDFSHCGMVFDKNEYILCRGFDIEELKAFAKGWKKGNYPFVLDGEVCVGVNPRYLVQAINWCKKDIKIYIHKTKPNNPIFVFGEDGEGFILPIRMAKY